jgi:hypothetical protein
MWTHYRVPLNFCLHTLHRHSVYSTYSRHFGVRYNGRKEVRSFNIELSWKGMWKACPVYFAFVVFLPSALPSSSATETSYSSWGETESTWYYGHCLAAVPDHGWWWLCSNRWNVNWRRKPKYSEKTCPSANLSTTIPQYLSGDRTRTATLGSRQLTAWAMALPCHQPFLFSYIATSSIL